MINIFRGNSRAMLSMQETDVHGSGALKTSSMPLLTDKSCWSCLLRLRNVRPGPVVVRIIGFFGCFYPKLALPECPRMRTSKDAQAAIKGRTFPCARF